MRTLPLKGIRRCAAEAAEGGAFVDGERDILGAGAKRGCPPWFCLDGGEELSDGGEPGNCWGRRTKMVLFS